MIWAEIEIGDGQKFKNGSPFFPDSYLNGDVLLGCDILTKANPHRDGKSRAMRLAGEKRLPLCMTVVDHYSRFVRFFPLNQTYTHIIKTMWQYLADYGNHPAKSSWTTEENLPARGFQQFPHTTPNHSLLYDPPTNPQGNSGTERMHRNLKSFPLDPVPRSPSRWPTLLQPCQITMNQGGTKPPRTATYFAFFSRHAPRLVGTSLPRG
ncbi:hypothetical protein GWK47_010673 [Chionoecetes opilio]|uniref:Integrase catalytic domain-containing protein n=1 Tax=Chionoecetes opilio TaxID=41210 RepID=A0A8J4Y1C2_CHIOP|nr:hypothetical protein GWK47_010673 [Chionoecetes opilio]